jgi:V8-like Glu-specific endopeptidase
MTPLVPKASTGRHAKRTEIYGTVAITTTEHFQFCSGTAIGPRIVVTAAHCMEHRITDDVLVVSGHRYAKNALFSRHIEVKHIYVHPNYPNPTKGPRTLDWIRQGDDIAILVLAKPVMVSWVPILSMKKVNEILVGSKVTISGYSNSALFIGRTTFRGRSETEIWVGRRGEPHHVKGNSGGPVYVYVGGRPYLLGAAVRTAEVGSISILVPAYLKWIKSKVKLPAGPAPPPRPATCSQSTESTPFVWLLLVMLWLSIRRATRKKKYG